MDVLVGKDAREGEPVYLRFNGSRAMLICGKRGSGKSYTMGVLVEELLGATHAPTVIVVDPMGIYHTMQRRNDGQSDELYRWGLSPRSYPVRLLVPGDPSDLYDPEVLPEFQRRAVEIVQFFLNPSDLSADAWCDLWDFSVNEPRGIALFRAVQKLTVKKRPFVIKEIIAEVETDGRAADVTKEAVIGRLMVADAWHIFTDIGYLPLADQFRRGQVNVLDVSRLEPGPRQRRNLVVSVLARSLFRQRSDERLREEFGLVTTLGPIWMAIDEAHQFAPAGYGSLAKEHIIRWVKEGRQPGLSMVVATQQPSAVDGEVLSQCDTILCHKMTTKEDIASLNRLSQDYMGAELRTYVRNLSRTGEAVLVDDERESVSMVIVRPRQSQHGGGTIPTTQEERFDLWSERA